MYDFGLKSEQPCSRSACQGSDQTSMKSLTCSNQETYSTWIIRRVTKNEDRDQGGSEGEEDGRMEGQESRSAIRMPKSGKRKRLKRDGAIPYRISQRDACVEIELRLLVLTVNLLEASSSSFKTFSTHLSVPSTLHNLE